ncbi:MAG: hypothetical protein EDM75_03570 [Chlorobiota bacterium]|nr:MAG: hypothetical protein EDM75_03570 [Chlorobiota bacterium]
MASSLPATEKSAKLAELKAQRDQAARLARLKKTRNNASARKRLDALSRAAAGTAGAKTAGAKEENLFPFILDAARAYCTEGEIITAMEKVFGRYKEPIFV